MPFHMLVIFLTLILTEISAYKRNKQKNGDFPWFFGNQKFSNWPRVAGGPYLGPKKNLVTH